MIVLFKVSNKWMFTHTKSDHRQNHVICSGAQVFETSCSLSLFLHFSFHSEYLDIYNVDMMSGPDEINKQQHHTTLYFTNYLVVRRGQEFQVKITFSRPYKPAEDKFAVEFTIGELSILWS